LKLHVAKIVAPVLVSLSALYAQDSTSTQFDGSRGNHWFGGSVGFSNTHFVNEGQTEEKVSLNSLNVSPMLRFFPTKGFILGPKIEYTRTSLNIEGESDSYSMLGTGAEIGGLFGKNKVKSYLITSPQFTSIFMSDEDAEPGFVLPITGGVLIPVFDNVALELQVGYQFDRYGGDGTNMLTFGFGFCGLGKKNAISTLTKFTSSTVSQLFW